jgi:DNA adenine methylase
MSAVVTRPLLRYHGGKWRLADWIISQFPEHQIYVEPYGGAASVLLRKSTSYAEIYNDLDGEIVNLFRVMRTAGAELIEAVRLTPYAREEFFLSFKAADGPVEQARRTLIRSFMGYGGNLTRANRDGTPQRTGFRTYSKKNRHSIPARDWAHLSEALPATINRLQGVIIEHRDAMVVMAEHDSENTLHYVDPPYVHSTRGFDAGGSIRGYRFEMDDAAHRTLATFLKGLSGKIIVSGYDCPLYTELYNGWDRIERTALADGARERTEVLWMRNCEHGLFKPQPPAKETE